jgi:hypothetical protein
MLALGLPEKAVEMGVDAIRGLGVDLPDDVEAMRAAIGGEALRIAGVIADRPVSELLNLPPLEDERVDRVVRVLKSIQPAAHIGKRPELFALSALKTMALMLEHGTGPWAPDIFAVYAVVLRGLTKDSHAAEKYMQLAVHYDRRKRGRLSPPVAFVNAWFIHHWLHPLNENLALAWEGAASATADGDVLYEGFCASSFVMYMAASGAALPDVVRVADEQIQRVAGRVRVSTFHCVLERQFALALAGRTEGPFNLTDSAYNEERDLASILTTTNYNQIPYFCLAKLRLHYYRGDYARALEYAGQAAPLLPAFQGQIGEWELTFYYALALLAGAIAGDRAIPESALGLAEQMSAWAGDNPSNFAHKRDLVLAELSQLENRPEEAEALYHSAASTALAQGFVHDAALTHERAASFFLSRSDSESARREASAACEAYKRWGAELKAADVEKRFGEINSLPSSSAAAHSPR